VNFRDYLTIGEVVQQLKTKFDDLSVSKLRFLEDEGLITPERTSGGYRKYSRDDLSRIELILRLQREKFLPLFVIKTKLDELERGQVSPELADLLQESASQSAGDGDAARADVQAVDGATAVEEVCDRAKYELCQSDETVASIADLIRDEKISEQFFHELKRYGIVDPAKTHGPFMQSRLTANEVDCVRAAWALRSVGIEPRHLRMYVTFADKEADMFELLLRPTYRHKTPRSKEMLGDACVDIVRQTELLKRCLLKAELKNKLEDLL